MTTKPPTAPRRHLAAGAICGAACVYLVWLAAAHPASLRVPPAIALLGAGVFALAAGRLLQLNRHPDSKGDGFAALIFAAFAVIAGWIALSPEAQACTVGFDGVPIGGTAGAGCRVPFGVGAIITSALALYAGSRWRKRRTRSAHGSEIR